MAEVIVIVVLIVIVAGIAYNSWQLRSQQTLLRAKATDQDTTIVHLNARLIDQSKLLSEKEKLLTEAEAKLAAPLKDDGYKLALALTLANSAYDALFVVDKDCSIIAINNAAEELFNIEHPIGQSVMTVTHIPELESMVNDALRNEEEAFEEQVTVEDCNYRVRSQVIRRAGHLFIGLAMQDVTRLVRLNRARRDMVANISHELRHPIANIRLTIDSLFHDQDKPKRKDSISSLRTIARETDALMWLVQEMSDLAMIESGQAIVRMVDTPLKQVAEEAIERVEDLGDHKDIKFVRFIPERLSVLCDGDLARRVIVNLLHNAVKWSPKGEKITITAVNSGDEVTISVLDNGPGVPDDQVERIFERFYQIDSSRSGSEGGSGLGLAICRHIVEAHGGRIWAEGKSKGPGGRFMFTLLAAEDQPEEDSFLQPC